MRLFPRTGSYLIDSMLFVLRALLFTLGVCLVVGVSALLVRATLVATDPHVSTRVSSLLALLVFVVYVGLPTYLLATRADLSGDGRESRPEPEPDSESVGSVERGGRAGTPAAVDEPTAPDEAAADAGHSDVGDSREGDPVEGGGTSDETGTA